MNPKFWLFARRYLGPDDDPGEGAAVDRGDDWTPTDDEEPVVEKKVEKKEKKLPATKKEALSELADEEHRDPGEGEPEEEDPPPEEEEEDDPKDAKRIPRKRHEAILARERERREELEKQLKGYQGQQQVVQTNEQITALEAALGKLQEEYARAMTDGEVAKATNLMQRIRAHDKAISNLENDAKLAAAEARAVESSRYAIALGRIEAAYPELDEDSDEFDKATYNEVLDLVRAYRAGGRTPTEALQKAVKVLLAPETAKQKAATSVKPRVDDEDDAQEKTRAERKTSATDKALRAKAGSPPTAVTRAGRNSNDAGGKRTAADVIKMSQKDFAALDEKELARLRGDEVDA